MLHSNGEYRHANTRTHASGSDGGERIVICETGKNTSTSKKMCSSHFFSAFGPVVAAIPPACLFFFNIERARYSFLVAIASSPIVQQNTNTTFAYTVWWAYEMKKTSYTHASYTQPHGKKIYRRKKLFTQTRSIFLLWGFCERFIVSYSVCVSVDLNVWHTDVPLNWLHVVKKRIIRKPIFWSESEIEKALKHMKWTQIVGWWLRSNTIFDYAPTNMEDVVENWDIHHYLNDLNIHSQFDQFRTITAQFPSFLFGAY